MKISPTAWGFIGLAVLAVVGFGIGAACFLFSDGHKLFGIDTLILVAGCVPYLVYIWKKTPLAEKKKKSDPVAPGNGKR